LFHEAKSIFLELAAANSLDRAIPLYLERIERHIRFPPGDWRGFDIMTEK
jgi:hypothetical protein